MGVKTRLSLLGTLIAALFASTLVAPPVATSVEGTVIYGSITGTDAGIPWYDLWAGNPDYGRAPADYGILYHNEVTMDFIKDKAQDKNVPWPKAEGTNLDPVEHNVYMLWGKKDNDTKILWKYGITKTSRGDERPTEQLPACRTAMKDQFGDDTPVCSWMWLRRETARRLEARRIEAAYFTEYKIRNGHCPPGATSCI
jgi:hypothetical protein